MSSAEFGRRSARPLRRRGFLLGAALLPVSAVACTEDVPSPGPDPEHQGDPVSPEPDGELATRPEKAIFLSGPFIRSPDSTMVGAPTPTGVALWDIETGAITARIGTNHDPDDQHHLELIWAWNGEHIAYEGADGDIRVVDLNGAEVAVLPRAGVGGVAGLTLSPDGTHLAVVGSGVQVWSLPDRELVAELADSLRVSATYTSDSRLVISGLHDHHPVQTWDVSGTQHLAEWDPGEPYYHLQPAPDGHTATLLRHAAPEEYSFVIDVVDLTDGGVLASHPVAAVPVASAISPDSTQLAWRHREGGRDNTTPLRILDLTTGEERTFEAAENPLAATAWSGNGERIYGFSRIVGVTEWDVHTGEIDTVFDLPA